MICETLNLARFSQTLHEWYHTWSVWVLLEYSFLFSMSADCIACSQSFWHQSTPLTPTRNSGEEAKRMSTSTETFGPVEDPNRWTGVGPPSPDRRRLKERSCGGVTCDCTTGG